MEVVIADGSPLALAGLRPIVEAVEGARVTAAVDRLEPALAAVATAANAPILVSGLRLVDVDAAALVRKARRHRPDLACAVLAEKGELTLACRAVEEGALAVCAIEDVAARLPLILKNLDLGLTALPSDVLRAVLARGADPLTKREHEILERLSEGLSNFQLSSRLGLSENTVKYHLKTIYQKLGVNNRGAAIAKYHSRRY